MQVGLSSRKHVRAAHPCDYDCPSVVFWNSNKVLYYFYGECHTPFLQSGAVFGAGIFLVVLYVRIGSGMTMAEDRR